MIVEYLRYAIPEHRRTGFVRDYLAARDPLLRSPFAQSFEIAQCADDPGQFILRIEWTSAEDHLTRFRQSPEFREFFALVRPYVGDIAEMRHYTPLG